MLIRSPFLVALSLAGAALFLLWRVTPRTVLSDLGFYVPLAVLIALTNPIFSHNGVTPLFFLNDNPVTLEAIRYGVFLAALLVAVLLWSKASRAVVTADRFLYLFGGALPKTALVLAVALRYVPLLVRRSRALTLAARADGLLRDKGFTDRLIGRGKIFAALVSWTLEQAAETGNVMRARGWGAGRRTNFFAARFRASDGAFLALTLLLTALTAFAALSGSLTFYFYPAFYAPRFTPLSWAGLAGFGALAALPFILETEEAIRWTRSRSGI